MVQWLVQWSDLSTGRATWDDANWIKSNPNFLSFDLGNKSNVKGMIVTWEINEEKEEQMKNEEDNQ